MYYMSMMFFNTFITYFLAIVYKLQAYSLFVLPVFV